MGTSNQFLSRIDQGKNDTVLCSVCIATYRRPPLLERLLRSLENQILPEGVEMEIIVVDNDADKSAEPVVSKFQHMSWSGLSYFNQPLKNISLTRNMAVEKASGEYILFIDDDEVASPRWLTYLMKTLDAFDADGVFGPVVPELNTETPPWMGDLFYRYSSSTGAKAESKWTGNCILKASLLKKMGEPFDPRYGITGGEDTHLFDRLEQQGARFVFCQEAWVSEYLPPSKTRPSSLFLRGLKGGNLHTRRVIEFAGAKKILVRMFMVAKAIAFGTTSLALMIGQFPNRGHRAQWLIKLGSNVGRLLAAFGWHYKGYR